MALLTKILGEELPTYTVGSGKEHINPDSGLPAFFAPYSMKIPAPDDEWGVWSVLYAWLGFKEVKPNFTVSYHSIADKSAKFDVEILHGNKLIKRTGPGSYYGQLYEDPRLNGLEIRAKSHSGYQMIQVRLT